MNAVKECLCCGKKFIPEHASTKYCGKACADKMRYKRMSDLQKINREIKNKEELEKDKICIVCGGIYHSKSEYTRFCGKRCAAKSRNINARIHIRPKEVIIKKNKKTDWKSIMKICNDNHLSYGEAVAKGLVE